MQSSEALNEGRCIIVFSSKHERKAMLKKRALFGLGMFLATCGTAFAEPASYMQWELGPEVYYAGYKEPDVDVKTDGVMYGAVGSWEWHNPSHWTPKIEGRAAWGEMDYFSTASGSLNNVD